MQIAPNDGRTLSHDERGDRDDVLGPATVEGLVVDLLVAVSVQDGVEGLSLTTRMTVAQDNAIAFWSAR